MKKAFVIYCPLEGGYWAGMAYNTFKGELYALKFEEEDFPSKAYVLANHQFIRALEAAKGKFIEIKKIYY
jgi:hypothetical protein